MARKTWIALTVGSVMAAALLAWAFAPRPVEVETAVAARGAFETAVEEEGRTRVRERFAVVAPMAGRLRRIVLREGDWVLAGQVLAWIDPLAAPLLDDRARREQVARVAAAQAARERAATRVRAADIGVDQAAVVQRRTEVLVAQGFVSPAQGDAARLALQAAQREREAAAGSEQVARHELEQARAVLGGPPSPRGAPAAALAVRAPVAGRILRVHQSSEGVVGQGTPLLDLADTASLEVVAELLTSDAAWALPGSPVRLERWGGPGVLSGRVRAVEPAAFTKVSALGVEEQRVNVIVDLEATSVPTAWGDGWRVAVRIVTRRVDDALTVPVSAVFPWAGGVSGAASGALEGGVTQEAAAQRVPSRRMGIFVVEGGRARLRAVQVADRHASQAWIADGLAEGARVIVYPPAELADGLRVRDR